MDITSGAQRHQDKSAIPGQFQRVKRQPANIQARITFKAVEMTSRVASQRALSAVVALLDLSGFSVNDVTREKAKYRLSTRHSILSRFVSGPHANLQLRNTATRDPY